jgi:hypothetical protein
MKKNKFVMKTIKFAVLSLLVALIVGVTSCNKLETPSNLPAEVSFNINSVTENGFKSSDTIICSTLKADYVLYKLDGGPFKNIPVFYVNDIPWTNSIKLTEGSHALNEFLVYSDNNTPTITTDDVLLYAVPHAGSPFSQYVTTTLDKQFNIVVDKKNEVKLDVVCL